MAYILGNKTCMDSLQRDVQDLQTVANDIFSHTGPVDLFSWKFPDKQAADVDVDDLLDLYDCSEEEDEAEDRQVAHIGLYELVIDRLLLLIKSISKFVDSQICSGDVALSALPSERGSMGQIVKQFWSQVLNLQTWITQVVSEKNSAVSKVGQRHKDAHRVSEDNCLGEKSEKSWSPIGLPRIPGTLGINPPNTSDMALMGMIEKACPVISKDSSSKACQTYETAFVPCESCDVVQRKMKEAGEIIVKICTDQGLPSSLKKFKGQIAHVEWLTFSDICHWMTEQNKDISRVGKQNDMLQQTINPLKNEVKSCQKRTCDAEEKAKMCEKSMIEEKETQSILHKQIEAKMRQQSENHSQILYKETQQREALKSAKEKLELEIMEIKKHLDVQKKSLKTLEADYKNLQEDLEIKQKEAERSGHLSNEIADLKVKLSEVIGQLDENSKLLAKEQGKNRSASKHSESLQSKQDNLLSRLESLGCENEDLNQQVVSLEEEKAKFEDTITELKVETKELHKKVKENEIVIKNLSDEKYVLEEAIKDTKNSIQNLERKVKEAHERERMMVEYPDLNGPVNTDFQGSGNIALDMSNQVKANYIRIKLLEEQNDGLEKSIQKIGSMCSPSSSSQQIHNTNSLVNPMPLWQQDSSVFQTCQAEDDQSEREQRTVLKDKPISKRKGKEADVLSSHFNQIKQEMWNPQEKDTTSQRFFVSKSPVENKSKHFVLSQPRRQGPAKVQMAIAPVNSSSIGAYIHMKKAHGVPSKGDKGKPPKGRPVSGSGKVVNVPSVTDEIYRMENNVSTFSCPRCDKVYMKSRDLEIHLSYCTA